MPLKIFAARKTVLDPPPPDLSSKTVLEVGAGIIRI
jgi:hypothetical protein